MKTITKAEICRVLQKADEEFYDGACKESRAYDNAAKRLMEMIETLERSDLERRVQELEYQVRSHASHNGMDISRLRDWANMPWWKRIFANGSSIDE